MPPREARQTTRKNEDLFEPRVFQDNGDGTKTAGLLDDYIRLVVLNEELATENATGIFAWSALNNIIVWPRKLPDQISAAVVNLSGSATRFIPAKHCDQREGKLAAMVQPVLEALAGIGKARRLTDRRYAA